MELGKARGNEAVRSTGNTHVPQPWQDNKLLNKSIDFHSQKHRLGIWLWMIHQPSDFDMRKELGLILDEDLTIDFSPLPVP